MEVNVNTSVEKSFMYSLTLECDLPGYLSYSTLELSEKLFDSERFQVNFIYRAKAVLNFLTVLTE